MLLILLAALLSIGGLAGGWYGTGLVHTQEPADSAPTVKQGPARGPVADALTAAGFVRGGVVDAAAVRALVDKLPADTHVKTPNYDRAAYGPSWADTDHNGCDQRNDVLARDLTAVTYT
ncbi:HNH endonuclease, partial [Clavibacter sp. VKM Ac-2872]|nr:HNH endonuclease [Clavibacter sp. VKM Ac-2872]